jgi:predicted nucleic acid-binding protein
MTLVVSDNSPLNLLIRVGHADVLPLLFQHVVIPPEVAAEMNHPKAPVEVRSFITAAPDWLSVQSPTTRLSLRHLDPGEAAAISLAAELRAALLIDELDGRNEAQTRGLTVIGAIGVLERAANRGLVQDLTAVHATIRALPFRISETLLQSSLASHFEFVRASTNKIR